MVGLRLQMSMGFDRLYGLECTRSLGVLASRLMCWACFVLQVLEFALEFRWLVMSAGV